MSRCNDHDEIGKVDVFAVFANRVMKFLEGLTSGDHVNYVHSKKTRQLLRDDDPLAKLFTKGMLS